MPAALAAPLLGDAPEEPPFSTGKKLLLSHVLTKFGSKAWEVTALHISRRDARPPATSQLTHCRLAATQFATPLLLLEFTPGDLAAPTIFGLCVFLFKVCWHARGSPVAAPVGKLAHGASRPAHGRSLSLGPRAVAGWTGPTGFA